MSGDPRIGWYEWAGGREALLRFGPEDGPVVVAALPLLEEANRTRAFAGTLLRRLAERGIGGVLPDLPGQGESPVPTERMAWAELRAAFAASCPPGAYVVAIRSGALLDGDARAAGRWRLAPQDAAELAREWRRVAEGDPVRGTLRVLGNAVAPAMLDELTTAYVRSDGGGVRVVRLASDPRPAGRHVDGAPLWRRAEPGDDPALAAVLADDIADWIATCGG